MIPRHFLLAGMGWLLAGSALAAGPVYKCSEGGKISYADRPCARGPSLELAPPVGIRPEGPDAVPTRDARTLLELEKLKIAREKEQERLRQRQERHDERAGRSATQRRKQCARLKLRHQWAVDDAARATGPKRDAALLKARRQAQNLALECPA